MQISFGKIAGLIGVLIPIGYIGYLLYFMGVGGGSFDGVVGIGLGPTILGLAIVGLLFALPLIIKLVRAASGVNRVPGASRCVAGAGCPLIVRNAEFRRRCGIRELYAQSRQRGQGNPGDRTDL